MTQPPSYAALQCRSSFSFLTAGSHPEELVARAAELGYQALALIAHPEELVARAAELGYQALALTDECSLAGVVRAHVAAKGRGLHLIVGSELRLAEGQRLVLLATDRTGYGNLAQLITLARRRSAKGGYRLAAADLDAGLDGCLALWLADEAAASDFGRRLAEQFPGRVWVGVTLHRCGGDLARLARVRRLATACRLPLVTAGGVRMHVPERAPLLDTLTAVRLGTTVAAAGEALAQNREAYLHSRADLARFYPPELLAETLTVAGACRFSLDELRYEYPDELVPPGEAPASYLRRLTLEGAARRWPGGVPQRVLDLLEHELNLIAELRYEPYFLTVHDIVAFARRQGILCQGRGSAANSAVCFCLGITEVDPARMQMLFERFISRERGEPPDIDVDFEHQRREEVIQYVYEKYGRDRAALAATVICYRPRSAVRDVGKALGMATDQVDRLARNVHWWDGREIAPERLREAGLDPGNPLVQCTLGLVREVQGFPRHLSQHVGGFVIARGALSRLVPIENAAMPGRSVIQWDKDDLDALGLLKVDCLALGMLSAIRRALDLTNAYRGTHLTMADIPAEDPAVYRMIQRGETTGVFQIESRAQMAMLPRLKPACFYDLVIEVAIVRPGPIQGDMVHPYLRRRQGLEPVTYPSEAVKEALGRTLGVPIFQEQVIKVATVAAGFSPGEADQVRRSMAAWRRRGGLERFRDRLVAGMLERGYGRAFAEQIYQQILGFGEYGFPESHAASFALLVYVSAWLKHHEPAAFFAALLNSQPMGFYAPAQLVREARRQGVEVRPADVRHSDWDCTLEPGPGLGPRPEPALRLGLRLVKGLSKAGAERLVAGRAAGPWGSAADLAGRVGLDRGDLRALAAADALAGLAGNRRLAAWQVAGIVRPLPLAPAPAEPQALPLLPPPTEGEAIAGDYANLGLTLRRHPLALLRGHLERRHLLCAREVGEVPAGARVATAGLVINRQRPGTASGVIFVTLEDETGFINLVVWSQVFERHRAALLGARLLGVEGEIQREAGVTHLVARRLRDYSGLLGGLVTKSRDFQ